jgi:hypothetical protein
MLKILRTRAAAGAVVAAARALGHKVVRTVRSRVE